jgi:pantoate kinase
MREASAFAPGHLTGFFQICDQPEDPLLKGSRGAGVSITRGVRTRVTAEPSEKTDYSIFIDGEESSGAFVSENVLEKMLEKLGEPHRIVVEHTVEVPLGAGFGSSGGGALTLSMALNEVLRLGMSFTETARVAHVAEIECRTGLGTVFAVTVGGFGALVKAGGPGIGEAVKYDRSGDLSVVYLHYGPIATKDALSNPSLRMKINELGGSFVDRIKDDLRPDLFMELSRKFTDHVGITTPRLMRILKAADDEGIPCAMAMFGEVVFTLISRDGAAVVADFFRRAAPRRNIVTVQIGDEGARLINK